MHRCLSLVLLVIGLSACTSERQARLGPVLATGVASRYADSLSGNPTASGEPYDPTALTCAHRKLELGTRLQVRRIKNDRVVECVVNDRGPYHDDRILDLSRAAAERLGFTGIAQVEIRAVETGDP